MLAVLKIEFTDDHFLNSGISVLPPSTSAVGLISGIAHSRNHSQLESVLCVDGC